MPPDPVAALNSLLRTATISHDDNKILEAANAAITTNPTDELAHHTKVVALLKLDRFQDAIRAVSDGGARLETRCIRELAYAHYKSGSLEKSHAILRSAGAGDRALDHIAAQVAYRAESFREAEAIYGRLLLNPPAQESNDLEVNMIAAAAQSEWCQSPPANPPLALLPHTFESFFNMACFNIARGSHNSAADLLHRSSKLCDACDDLTQAEKADELRPILAQQAYIHAKLRQPEQSLAILQSLRLDDKLEADLGIVLRNNTTVLQTDPSSTNPFLLQRQFASILADAAESNLFSHQKAVLARNLSITDLQACKVDGVKEKTRKLLKEANSPTILPQFINASLLHAAAQTQGSVGKAQLRILLALLKKSPDDLGLVLIIVHVYLQQNQTGVALSLLESILNRLAQSQEQSNRDARFSPGLVALTVDLMRAQGRESSAMAELAKAATYWLGRAVPFSGSFLGQMGIELAVSSLPSHLSLSTSILTDMQARDQGSPMVSAALVAALARSTSTTDLEPLASQLPSIDKLVGQIDVAALVAAGVPTVPDKAATSAGKRAAPEHILPHKTPKRRRIRAKKAANGIVEGKDPDPERWLPLRDRSTYRPPKSRKGKKKAVESTQGGLVKEETLDLVGGGGLKVEKAQAANQSRKKRKGKK